MKETFSNLSPEEQNQFGNGCTMVPDFGFTADCRHHDFNYSRGGKLKDKFKADLDLFKLMWNDSTRPWQYIIAVVYYLGLTIAPIPYVKFTYGRWRTKEEILKKDKLSKMEYVTKVPVEVIYVAIAAFGGISRYLQRYIEGGKFNIQHLIAHTFVSVFSGYMFLEVATLIGASPSTQGMFAGLGGFMGVRAIEVIEVYVRTRFFGDKVK